MKPLAISTFLLLVSSPLGSLAREKSVDGVEHIQYASGEVMDTIMAHKEATWEHYRRLEYFKPGRYKSSNNFYPCKNGYVTVGRAAGSTFQCLNLDVTGYLTHNDLGSTDGIDHIGSSIWGVTLEGREFAIIGQANGAAFAEVVGKGWWNYIPYWGKKEGTLDCVGRLPQHSFPIIWREIKTYKHYAIIGSEAVGHGIRIFDLRKLLEVRPKWNPLSTASKTFDIINDDTVSERLELLPDHPECTEADNANILAVIKDCEGK